eukprot:2626565-Pyramimonas_sp.AAC.1
MVRIVEVRYGLSLPASNVSPSVASCPVWRKRRSRVWAPSVCPRRSPCSSSACGDRGIGAGIIAARSSSAPVPCTNGGP